MLRQAQEFSWPLSLKFKAAVRPPLLCNVSRQNTFQYHLRSRTSIPRSIPTNFLNMAGSLAVK
jgi:hypothetical protein